MDIEIVSYDKGNLRAKIEFVDSNVVTTMDLGISEIRVLMDILASAEAMLETKASEPI